MKKIFLLFLFLLFASTLIYSQPWQLQIVDVPANAIVCSFSPVNDNICWAGWTTCWTSETDFFNGYIRTTDGGITWAGDTISLTEFGMIYWMEALDANTAYIAVETWADWGMQGIYKTTDGGATWEKNTTAYANAAYGPGYIHFFDINNGVAVGEVNGNAPDTTHFEIYTTTNGGNDWNLVPEANIPPINTADFFNEFLDPTAVGCHGNCIWFQTLVGLGEGPRIFKTTDKGYNWTAIDPGFLNTDPDTAWYKLGLSFQNATTGLMVAYSYINSVIKRTTNAGATWDSISIPSNVHPFNISYIPGTEAGYVVAGDNGWLGNGYFHGSAYTLNGGNTWTQLDDGNYVFITFAPDRVGWAAQWATNNVYKYVGPPNPIPVELTSFTASVNGNEVLLKWTTASEKNNKGFEVERGVNSFQSAVGNSKWEKVGFVKGNGTTIEQNNYIFFDKNLTAGKYLYRLKQIDYDGTFNYSKEIDVSIKTVTEYFLGQNYPNPFNPNTIIEFGIKEKVNVSISILNTIGEEVTVLLNEEKEEGNYQIEFDAASLPSGVYFYKIKAGHYIAVKKMLLLK